MEGHRSERVKPEILETRKNVADLHAMKKSK